MAAHGDPLARGVEVGLGRDGILVVAEVVADVGEQLDERDADVRDVALGPARQQQRQAVEDELAQAREVARQVVELRLLEPRLDARADRQAVEVARAVDVEDELGAVERGIGSRDIDEPQRVRREVPHAVEPDDQEVVHGLVGVDDRVDVDDRDVAHALAALEAQVALDAGLVLAQLLRQRAEEVRLQLQTVAGQLDVVQAEAVVERTDGVAALVVLAAEARVRADLRHRARTPPSAPRSCAGFGSAPRRSASSRPQAPSPRRAR